MTLSNKNNILIPLDVITDERISLELKGFLSCICCLCEIGEPLNVEKLSKRLKEDEQTICRLIKECMKFGYLKHDSTGEDSQEPS